MENMTQNFTADEFIKLAKKMLIHAHYIIELDNGELALTVKGQVAVREIEHI